MDWLTNILEIGGEYLNYADLKKLTTTHITTKSFSLPVDALTIAAQLHIRVKNSIECKKDFANTTYPLYDCNAIYSFYNGEYVIYYDEKYPYKNFAIAHEVSHHLLQHTRDTYVEHQDAQLLAAMIVAPDYLIKRSNIKTAAELSTSCKIPIDVAEEYWRCLDIDKNRFVRFSVIAVIASIVICLIATIVTENTHIPSDTYNIATYTPATTNSPALNEFVFVTKSGNKYHKSDCFHIKNSYKIEISLDDAIQSGYEPCKDCFDE